MPWGKPIKKPPTIKMPNIKPGTATTTSTVRNVSNSGEMSTQTSSTGATGSVINTTTYGNATFESDYIKNMRKLMGL